MGTEENDSSPGSNFCVDWASFPADIAKNKLNRVRKVKMKRGQNDRLQTTIIEVTK